jgi:hypothetical protein
VKSTGGISIKLSAHQPNHWPYLGFIDKMKSSDVFIIYDVAQFVENDFHHRNRIRINNPQGYKWLTVPVIKERMPIRDIMVENEHFQDNRTWGEIHNGIVSFNYRNAKYYDEHVSFFDRIYSKKWGRLIDLNMAIINYLRDIFSIETPVLMSSGLACFKDNDYTGICEDIGSMSSTSSDTSRYYIKNMLATKKIIDMCKEVEADTFISGAGGRDYLLEDMFAREGIKLEYQAFHHPTYKQCYSPFMPNMSSLDYIVNVDAGSATF